MADGVGVRERARGAASGVRATVRRVGRGRLAVIVLALIGCAGVALFANWLIVGRFQVATENAYVRADISNIAAKVEGYVRTVPAPANSQVKAGDVLVEIDPTDYQARVAAARAALARAVGERRAEQANRAWAAAEVGRYRPLAERGILAPSRMQQIEIQSRQAGGGLEAAAAAVAAARAQLETAELDLSRTIVRAPIAGVVGDRQVQVGQLVRPGAPLMSIVPLDAVYVVANFKETQIAHFHAGQRVAIRPDIDRGVRLTGVIDSLAPASGSEFSIIPTDTATGNFAKIVQRVPVRIRIEPHQRGAELLRPGLSVAVTVDTRG